MLFDGIDFLLLFWMSGAFHCLTVCACVDTAGCVQLQIGFGSGLEGWGSEFSAGFRLRCVICLPYVNQLPSAGVKVWFGSKVANNKVLRLLRLLRHRHKDTRADTHKAL